MSNEPRVLFVKDGKWPEAATTDDLVVVIPTKDNAAMWLELGDPVAAFETIEGVIGSEAQQKLEAAGWPVAYDPEQNPRRHDGHLIRSTLDKAVQHTIAADPKLSAVETAAMSALDTLARARAVIEGASPEAAAMMAEMTTRAALMGFAAQTLGISPAAMEQPSLEQLRDARAKRSEYQSRWRDAVRDYIKALQAEQSPHLALTGRQLWRGFLWSCAPTIARIKASRVGQWPDDATGEKFIRDVLSGRQ